MLLYRGRQTGAADLAAARPIIHCETDHSEEQGLPRTLLMNFYFFYNLFIPTLKLYLLLHKLPCLLELHNLHYDLY